jgi:hypothetical protein
MKTKNSLSLRIYLALGLHCAPGRQQGRADRLAAGSPNNFTDTTAPNSDRRLRHLA